jgi:hypothetical protein
MRQAGGETLSRTELVPRGAAVAGFSPFTLLNIHNWLAPFRDLLTRTIATSWSYSILDVTLLYPAILATCLGRRAHSVYFGLLIVLVVNLLIVSVLSLGSIEAGPLPLERMVFTIRFYAIYPFLIVVGACLAFDEEKLTKFFEAFFWTGSIALLIGIIQFALYTLFGYEILTNFYSEDAVSDITQSGTSFEYDWVVYRVNSIFNFVSQYAGFCFLYFVVCLCAFIRTGSAIYKYGCILAIPALVTSGSRAGILVAGLCMLLYFNTRHRLLYMIPSVLLFSAYVAPQLVSVVLGLVEDHTAFVGFTLKDAIDMSEPISFRAGLNTTFFYAYVPELSLRIESSVGKVLVELGFLYAIPLLLAAVGVIIYGSYVLMQGLLHRTNNNLWRSAVAGYVTTILVLCVKGTLLEAYPQSPYLFIMIGILVGGRPSPEKVKVPREVRPLVKAL